MVRDSRTAGRSQASRRYGAPARLRTALALALTAALLVANADWLGAWNEPNDFRGVPWGGPPEDLHRLLPVEGCLWVPETQPNGAVRYGLQGCMPDWPARRQLQRIGDVSLYGLGFTYLQGRLGVVGFGFETGDYSKLRAAFTERYGLPTKTDSRHYTNSFGAIFEEEQLEWRGKAVTVSLTQGVPQGSRSVGAATYMTEEYLRAAIVDEDRKARDRVKGL